MNKYIVELETNEEYSDFECTSRDSICRKEKCPMYSNTGDSFIDGCYAANGSVKIKKVGG